MSASFSNRVFLYGASGHAKVVAEALARSGCWDIAFIADGDPAKDGSKLLGYPVFHDSGDIESKARENNIGFAFVSIGRIDDRVSLSARLRSAGFTLITVIDPSAVVSRSAVIGSGTVVMPGCVVNANAVIGADCIVNTSASIDHDCTIGDGSHVAPGSRLCGGVRIGQRTLIGAGSVVIPGCSVGDDVTIGAGSVVTRSIADGVRAAGSPCRPL